jgi:predicted outer membrane protein
VKQIRHFSPGQEWAASLSGIGAHSRMLQMLGSTASAAQAARLMERQLARSSLANFGVSKESLQRTMSFGLDPETLRQVSGIGSANDIAKQYEKYLGSIAQQQETLQKLQRYAISGLTAQDLARQFQTHSPELRVMAETVKSLRGAHNYGYGGLSAQYLASQLIALDPAIQTMEAAKKSLERLWPTIRDIDFGQLGVDGDGQQEAARAAEDITQSAASKADLQVAVNMMVSAIEKQQNPAVKVLLWLYFKKVLEILISGAVGAVMGYYGNILLAQSPQGETKAVKEIARQAVGSLELLSEYRYVATKVLVVRQNPRARSPQVGHLTFGRAVQLIKKDRGFALVVWTDPDSDATIQGWVFARYLEKFR